MSSVRPKRTLWALLKAPIYKDHPELEHASDTDETLDKLIDAAIEAWDRLGDDLLCNLSDMMPKRVKVVIEAEGWYAKY
jgi:hypothetical protein